MLRSTDYRTATYNAILDSNGEMRVAIADMDIFSSITPAYVRDKCNPNNLQVERYSNDISNASIVFVDANVPQDTILKLTKLVGRKTKCTLLLVTHALVWFEPTSVAKSIKVAQAEILSKLHYMSPNKYELIAIAKALDPTTDETRYDLQGCMQHVHTIMKTGVQNVIVKMGADGVLVGSTKRIATDDILSADGSIFYHVYPAPQPEKIVSVTGAGDSLGMRHNFLNILINCFSWSYTICVVASQIIG